MHAVTRLRLALAGLLAALVLGFAPVALAQGADPAEEAQRKKALDEGYQPVAGAPDTEKVDANKLVVGAYGAIFVAIFGFMGFIVKKQSEMAKEMTDLARQIGEHEDD